VQIFAALVHKPEWWKGGSLGASVHWAHDEAKHPLNEFTSTTVTRHGGGVRLSAQSDPSRRLSTFAYAAYSVRIDDDPYARATQVATGRDRLFELVLQCTWRVADGWLVQPNIAWVRGLSNIALYSFSKLEGGVMVRREFQ